MSNGIVEFLKSIASRFPESWQVELKRLHYKRAIRLNRFLPDEAEDAILDSLIKPGDWVIDVGANIGHYSKRFSDLVGTGGRVIAIEPVPTTFALLSANASRFPLSNMTMLNVAASDVVGEVGFTIPKLSSGLKNYYMANIADCGGELHVMSLPIDFLRIPHRVSLIKIDVEGHEAKALKGMAELIARDHPVLILETRSDAVLDSLVRDGYAASRMNNSPNVVCRYAR